MTAAELRKMLEGVPDDMPVLVYREGDLTKEVTAGIVLCAEGIAPELQSGWADSGMTGPLTGHLRPVGEFSRHPEGTVGEQYFLVC